MPDVRGLSMSRMLKAVLVRLAEDNKQTLGSFTLYKNTFPIFKAQTLELPFLNNEQFVSCIPAGKYLCKRRRSSKHGNHFIVKLRNGDDIPGREFILLHKGNFRAQTSGCILLGRDHSDIDRDGYLDVTHSVDTLNELNNATDEILFPLTIIDETRAFS